MSENRGAGKGPDERKGADMASINGVQIKSLKSFTEHEGMTAHQGNVYIDGKKQGFWTQDFSCGADHFHFRTTELDRRAADYRHGFPKEHKLRNFINAETLLASLVDLMEDEKHYKRELKEGFTAMITITDGYHVRWYSIKPTCAEDLSKEDIIERYGEGVNEVIGALYENAKQAQVRIYTSLEDFDLTVDPKHPAPEWLMLA